MTDRILIIDDDLDTLKLVGLMLQRQGYDIIAASSGEQGLAKAAAEKPDLVLVDIMMPGMDGYEVTRRLRQEPATKSTPILIFTARTQLDDKVTGFEVGADDYLTKPTHPAELQAHVRQLLSRVEEHEDAPPAPVPAAATGRAVGVLAVRGGLGVSTVAVNLAAALQMRTQQDVILAEFTPGNGTIGTDLGFSNPRGLSDLLSLKPEEITAEKVGASLVKHSMGLKMLLASQHPRDVTLLERTAHFERIFSQLITMARFVVLDLGTGLQPFAEKLLPLCQGRIVITEGAANTVTHTRVLLDEIASLGIAPETIHVVLNNRVRFDTQVPFTEVQRALGHPVQTTLTPAPEMMAAAARRQVPAVVAMPEDVTSQQILRMADGLIEREKSR